MALKVHGLIAILCMVVVVTRCEVNHSVKMRLTQKGMQYTANTAMKVIERDIKEKPIKTQSGKTNGISYAIKDLKISDFTVPEYKVNPVEGVGIRAEVSGIGLKATGSLWFQYKKSWFKFSKTVGLDIKTNQVDLDLTVSIGKDASGRPTADLKSCQASVKEISLHFSGGSAWLFNSLSGLIESRLKKSFGSMICSIALKEISTKGKAELATFPVVQKVEGGVEIDYRLTKAPVFTPDYMEIYFKGEFKLSKNPAESHLNVPLFKTSSDSSKMVYFWVTDYTVNTAADVFHKDGQLHEVIKAWDSQVPTSISKMLNTAYLSYLFPELRS
jgi:hypothetical protein